MVSGAGRRQGRRESLAVEESTALWLRIGECHPAAIGEDRSRNHDQAGGAGTGMCGIVTMRAATARSRSMSPILRVRGRPLVPIRDSMRMGIVMFDRHL